MNHPLLYRVLILEILSFVTAELIKITEKKMRMSAGRQLVGLGWKKNTDAPRQQRLS